MRKESLNHKFHTRKDLGKCSPASSLVDQFGRTFTYLRIAINQICNLRCIYCMPEEGFGAPKPRTMMSPNEIDRILRVSAELGVDKIRFTGGEPLLHPHIIPLVEMAAKNTKIRSVHLTTNAILLKEMVYELKQAGLSGLNISMDTLQKEKYFRMTRRDRFDQAMAGLKAALSAGISSIKINSVLLRGFNDTELKDFVALTKEHPITVRFIELMPFDAQQIWKTGKFMSAEHIKQNLRETFPTMIQVKGSKTEHSIYQAPGHKGKVAIIPAFSRSLCGHCNRIRITADGKIRNCLFACDESNLLGLMQNGGTDEDLKAMLKQTMWEKACDGWEAQDMGEETRVSMVQIGG